MTNRITHLTPCLIDLGDFIQKHVLEGYTHVDGYPRRHGHQYEIFMEKVGQNTEEATTEDTSTEEKPKRGRKAAVAEDK